MSVTRTGKVVFFLLVAVLVPAGLLFGQFIEKGAISGIVKDPSGAVVTNATVKVTSVATKSQRTMTTDSNGRYV
ncbi:MAG: carboxypeptidase-like regulatory domain-containing protein, partial [Candidatus Methylomirabilales bacterium]